jgi:hypothetical protein
LFTPKGEEQPFSNALYVGAKPSRDQAVRLNKSTAQKEQQAKMRRSTRSYRVLLAVTLAIAASVGAGTARAGHKQPSQPSQDSQSSDSSPSSASAQPPAALPASTTPPASQLVDTSKQVADIQKQIAELQTNGQVAKTGIITASAAATGSCGFQTASPVFSPWGDLNNYALAPQGDISSSNNWLLMNTSLAAGHDPYTAGSNSLLMPQNDSEAFSPAMCVNLSNPGFRFFLKDTGGNGSSDLLVSVVYEDTNGKIQRLPLAKLRAGTDWAPTISIPIAVNILSAANASGVTSVAFDFKAENLQKNESYSLDSLYIDPYMSR